MSAPLVLDGDLTVFAVAALKDRLLAALNDDATLTLDGSAVSEIDGAGIQLLLATCKEAKQRGGGLILQAPSEQMREALDLIDVRAEFCAPTLETSE